jgi:hypothetical protein
MLPTALIVFNFSEFPHRHCTLDPDSLDPLAQAASLRELGIHFCPQLTLDALQQLFSASVQGCLLRVSVSACVNVCASADGSTQMRQAVVAQRGSRDTPRLTY